MDDEAALCPCWCHCCAVFWACLWGLHWEVSWLWRYLSTQPYRPLWACETFCAPTAAMIIVRSSALFMASFHLFTSYWWYSAPNQPTYYRHSIRSNDMSTAKLSQWSAEHKKNSCITLPNICFSLRLNMSLQYFASLRCLLNWWMVNVFIRTVDIDCCVSESSSLCVL